MKHVRHKKAKLIVLGLVATLALPLTTVILIVTNTFSNAPEGMREVKSYNTSGICLAIMPECGYCPEATIDNKCYVRKGEYEQYL